MCGIFYYNNFEQKKSDYVYNLFSKISHRGPDSTSVFIRNKHFYGFHRLSIINNDHNDMVQFSQPYIKNNIIMLCNGEIYNWKYLVEKNSKLFNMELSSDCEIILYLYLLYDKNFTRVIQELDGEFSIILHDLELNIIYCCRDFIGIRPLFWNLSLETNELFISSEIKSTGPISKNIKHVEPRKIYSFSMKNNSIENYEISNYWNFPIYSNTYFSILTADEIIDKLYENLSNTIKLRVQSDRPIGCLLSGGIDSSLIVSLVSKIHPNIHCFTIGTENSPDVVSAKIVAEYLNVPLQIIPFDYQTGFNELKNIINCLETWDITTIRASTPQYLLGKYISQNTDIKVILSGEGSDEIFSGYLYSHLSPNKEELWKDGVRLLSELYYFDCLRTDRTLSNWGLEVRVPFLNKDLVSFVLNIDPQYRTCNKIKMEKLLLRKMILKYKLLPEKIALRRKEAFSDAVSKDTLNDSWISFIQQKLGEQGEISEKNYYIKIFNECFPKLKNLNILPHYWMPQWSDTNDPSATTLDIY